MITKERSTELRSIFVSIDSSITENGELGKSIMLWVGPTFRSSPKNPTVMLPEAARFLFAVDGDPMCVDCVVPNEEFWSDFELDSTEDRKLRRLVTVTRQHEGELLTAKISAVVVASIVKGVLKISLVPTDSGDMMQFNEIPTASELYQKALALICAQLVATPEPHDFGVLELDNLTINTPAANLH